MVSEDTLNLDFIKKLLEDLPEEPQAAAENADADVTVAPEKPAAVSASVMSEKPQKTAAPKKPADSSQPERKKKGSAVRALGAVVALALVIVSLAACAGILGCMTLMFGGGSAASAGAEGDVAILDKFDMFMTNQISSALEGVLRIDKVYWLSDTDLVAPEPDPANYGTASSASELQWLLDEAAALIDGQDMLFDTQTQIWEEDQIYYYYDETILVITWKEVIDNCTYTISEVKIAHPSQFRRFLADGTFGSDKQYVTTEMAASVNAVVASSGDFYKHRYNGVVVHEGEIKRAEFKSVDTCFINDQGELLFSRRKEFQNEEQAQKFVDDNHVRFSLAFGPILVDDGVACPPAKYLLGEIDGYYSRMALCQRDDLHYLLINSTAERDTQKRHTIEKFAKIIEEKGCEKAYALDGGQTTVITMDDEYINDVDYGFQRQISDIIYFATALPNGE